ncbi:MAG TPA: class I SAM-dependent methyltransferase [Thermoanaerobaculia bacterium]|nr:class I SAM-dependent methyltransferase [Thermoanaerobaculia bacterium]
MIGRFVGEPTRDLAEWFELWTRDLRFPLRSRRKGALGSLAVLARRALRPLVRFGGGDLWDRQQVFNLILLEKLQELERAGADLEARLSRLETFAREGVDQVLRHNDALFSRLDQKVDLYRRGVRDLSSQLGAALALAEGSPAPARTLAEHAAAMRYAGFEDRHRGTEEEIATRVERYLGELAGCSPILDLGCGRGEALAAFRAAGHQARGVDLSAAMVARCRERGLDAVQGDLIEVLAQSEPGSLGGVVSFHVVEHLPPEVVDRLLTLAWRALRDGGKLILETPNPESLVAGASRFWLDPTHRRPVHPERLASAARQAGFESVEIRPCSPFGREESLPEVSLHGLEGAPRDLADAVNRLRDRLDDLLYGDQDYALVATRTA